MRGAEWCLVPLLWLAAAGGVRAQQGPPFELERQGRLEEAAVGYREILLGEPARLDALLGLERVLTALGRADEMAGYVAGAVLAAPERNVLREVEFRYWSQRWGTDSAVAASRRWRSAVPESAEPYRRLAMWLARDGDVEQAIAVLEEGRARLGDAGIAHHAARLYMAAGDWPRAAGQWRAAVAAAPALEAIAVSALGSTPPTLHANVLWVLADRRRDELGQRMAAQVLVEWGRAEEGWTLLDDVLPPQPDGAALLRRFADRAARYRDPGALRARGFALERLASLAGGVEAERARLAAAQAFADAGDLGAAQRLLGRVGGAGAASADDAMATLIGVLAGTGDADDAERQYRGWAHRFSSERARALRELIAEAHLIAGAFDRAERLLEGDSTVSAEAVLGWVALYRGRLADARTRFRAAGPAARRREVGTHRATTLALLERVDVDESAALGTAMHRLARADTAGAVSALREAASEVPAAGGRSDLLAFAAELVRVGGDLDAAERLFREALSAEPGGAAAPTAALGLARVYHAAGRHADAARQLEELILAYPGSAVVPEARRLLDLVRGRIPRS